MYAQKSHFIISLYIYKYYYNITKNIVKQIFLTIAVVFIENFWNILYIVSIIGLIALYKSTIV